MTSLQLPRMTDADDHTISRRLSHLWLFATLNMVFRDIHEMAKASRIEEILTGRFNGNLVTDDILLLGGVLVELVLLMIIAGHFVSARSYRVLNLLFAPLALIGVIASSPGDMDDYFFVCVKLLTFAYITYTAWQWRPAPFAGGYASAAS